MGDSMSDVLQELSGLLRRITEQNDASWKRQEEFRLRMEGQRDSRAKFREDWEGRNEQFRTQMSEFRSNADKSKEAFERRHEEDQHFRQRLLQTLNQQNQLLETLIARLKDNPKKGPL
jgi:hypothetical protein